MPVCQKNDGGVVVALGGSNTAGANARYTSPVGATKYGRPHTNFAKIFSMRIMNETKHRLFIRQDGGSSPMHVGACSSQFVPEHTIVGTVEYLPNIGYIKDDAAETGAMKSILLQMRDRGALSFIVNIVSGSERWKRDFRSGSVCSRLNASYRLDKIIGCMNRERQLLIRDTLVDIALKEGAVVIEVDADTDPHLFGSDSFHMNQEGHNLVAERMWDSWVNFKDKPCTKGSIRKRSSKTGETICLVGQEVSSVVSMGASHGFSIVDMNPSSKKTPKFAWQATNPSSHLRMCFKLPLRLAKERAKKSASMVEVKGRNFSLPKQMFRFGLGLLRSHELNPPLFGVASVECSGGCKCECRSASGGQEQCSYDMLSRTTRATITDFKRIYVEHTPTMEEENAFVADTCGQTKFKGGETCVLTVRNTDTNNERSRVAVRSVVFGLNDHRTNFRLTS